MHMSHPLDYKSPEKRDLDRKKRKGKKKGKKEGKKVESQEEKKKKKGIRCIQIFNFPNGKKRNVILHQNTKHPFLQNFIC